jgi:hypothetical protein
MIKAMIRKQRWQMHWRQVLLGTVKIFSITLKQRADASVVGYSGEGVASCAVGPNLEIILVSLARLYGRNCLDGQEGYLCISADTLADGGF